LGQTFLKIGDSQNELGVGGRQELTRGDTEKPRTGKVPTSANRTLRQLGLGIHKNSGGETIPRWGGGKGEVEHLKKKTLEVTMLAKEDNLEVNMKGSNM